MTKSKLLKDIQKITGDMDHYIVFYLKGQEAGFMRLPTLDGRTKKSITNDIEVRNEGDGTFRLWFNHNHGYCGYWFDNYSIRSY